MSVCGDLRQGGRAAQRGGGARPPKNYALLIPVARGCDTNALLEGRLLPSTTGFRPVPLGLRYWTVITPVMARPWIEQ